jgi:HD-GYP domain-containing protein (c-di-GMP phosphodiesterase class II)
MPTNTSTQIRFDPRRVNALRHSLREFFGVAFDLWFFDEQWLRIPEEKSSEYEVVAGTETACLDAARTATTSIPNIASTLEGSVLVIPLPKRHRQQLFATARFQHAQAEIAIRLARLFVKNLELNDEVVELRQEHEAFLRQVTNDFEELTFLRGMASLLEVSDLTFDFVAMAKAMLPTLKPLVDSDALVLVTADALTTRSEQGGASELCVWCGARCLDDQLCLKLVQRFRQSASHQPVVKNYFNRIPDGSEFVGLHSFIMVPIASGDVTIGWLLALNRNNERNNNVEELPWELSYLEFGTHEATLMSSSAAILATHARNVQLFKERENLLVSIVRALVSAVEAKDEYTRGHSERVALYGRCIAQQMGLDETYCEQLYLSGLLHDVGKIGVQDAILSKAGPLTDDEFEEIKKHPDKGWQILRDLTPLKYVLDGILHHHEQFDGRGYPDRLAGSNIPLQGRILAVADAYDAMTSDRPYRQGMPHEKAESILKTGAGKQWDADIVEAFFHGMEQILEIKSTYLPVISRLRKESGTTL